MKKLIQYPTEIEATLAAQFLNARGIPSEVIGSREYSSIIVGGDLGFYELYVDEKNHQLALQDLQEFKNTPMDEELTTSPSSYFKKALVSAFVAIVFLPLVFNYFSLKNLCEYNKTEKNSLKKFIMIAVVLALQIPGIAVFLFILNLAFNNKLF